MLNRTNRLWNQLKAFHREDRGAEVLQIIMLIAVAAVCLVLVKLWAQWYFEYTRTAVEILVEN